MTGQTRKKQLIVGMVVLIQGTRDTSSANKGHENVENRKRRDITRPAAGVPWDGNKG